MIAIQGSPRTVSLPVQEAPSPTLPDHLSWSQVSLMRACPQKFQFQYVLKAAPDFVPSSLKFGSAIHATLEAHFRAFMEGIATDGPALLSAYRSAWLEGDDMAIPVRFNKTEDAGTLEATAKGILEAFLLSPLAEPAGRVIAVEEPVRGSLAPDLPDIVARVDLIWQDDKAVHVLDFKTSRSRWNAEQLARNADQLRLYQALANPLADQMPIQLHFAVLTKAKRPVVEILDVPPNDAGVGGIIEAIRPVWEAITVGNFYPVPSPQNCTTCPFKSRCPAWAASSPQA